jgi:hypothetical protein
MNKIRLNLDFAPRCLAGCQGDIHVYAQDTAVGRGLGYIEWSAGSAYTPTEAS